MRALWASLLAVTAVLASSCATAPEETGGTTPAEDALGQAAEVVTVIDGDTIEVRLPSGIDERVRLIGIDAPELGETGHDTATDRLTELVEGEEVRLEADVSDRDRFGRLLRYVTVGDLFVNEVLVREGLAAAVRFPPDTARAETLEAAQSEARAEQLGLWGLVAEPVTTEPTGSSPVVITEVRFDAAGDDNENLDDEWVRIANTGSEAVDLSGWELTDDGPNHVFVFPRGFLLDPGADVRVLSGCGDPTPTSLHFCNTDTAVWNNDGDTARLFDASGRLVDEVSG